MQPDGLGALYLAYEQLKQKLQERGYFEKEHKQTIPKFPKHIAIITSPTGAAVRDIITTIRRRFPIVQLTVIPVTVQGEGAAESIKRAIEFVNNKKLFDTIIIGRGGGSIEDLWCFNEEKVVKSIFHSSVPVISGIGHETDITISDYVADLRAPTPTAAAELAVPSLTELQETIIHMRERLTKLSQLTLLGKTDALQTLRKSYAFHYPKQILNEKEQQVDRLTDKLISSLEAVQQNKHAKFNQLITRLQAQHPRKKLVDASEKLERTKEKYVQQTNDILTLKQQKLSTMIDKLRC